MKTPLISAVLASAVLAMPALAGSLSSNQFKFDVRYDRAALDKGASVASEYQRIHKQVTKRCKAENKDFNPIRRASGVRNCISFAMDNVIREVDHAQLTAYHREQKYG